MPASISALWPRVYAHFQVCVSVLVCTHARKHQCAVAEGVCTLSGVCACVCQFQSALMPASISALWPKVYAHCQGMCVCV